MKLAGKKEIRMIDRICIESYHIPEMILMEHAAMALFDVIKEKFDKNTKFGILCGKGNNGGDGFALARLLYTNGYLVFVQYMDQHMSKSAELNFDIMNRLSIPNLLFTDHLPKCDVWVDAIFGIGIDREVEGKYKQAIQLLNQNNSYVISIDIPSGLCCESGKVLGVCVNADLTITFIYPKIGCYLFPGYLYSGTIIVKDLNIDKELLENLDIHTFLNTKETLMLPKRFSHSHKGTYGHVGIIGGQLGMCGAVSLCAKACMSAGTGKVTMLCPKSIISILQTKLDEVMCKAVNEIDGHIGVCSKELLDAYDILCVGMGLGKHQYSCDWISSILDADKPCVIDADGIYALSNMLDKLKDKKQSIVLTPHPKEFSYLCHKSVEEIIEKPLEIAKEFVKEYPVVLVLKMEHTIICYQDEAYININGNSGLAKGGSGDVLSGIIASFMAQHLSAFDSARLAVYLHARTADILKKEKSEYALTPTDVIAKLGRSILEMENIE